MLMTRYDQAMTAVRVAKPATFREAWKIFEQHGYEYGEEALEQLQFGWDIRDELVEEAPAFPSRHLLDCDFCGSGLESGNKRSDEYFDSEEIVCPDCNTTNCVTVDERVAYVGHWICAHGADDETPCNECDAAL